MLLLQQFICLLILQLLGNNLFIIMIIKVNVDAVVNVAVIIVVVVTLAVIAVIGYFAVVKVAVVINVVGIIAVIPVVVDGIIIGEHLFSLEKLLLNLLIKKI